MMNKKVFPIILICAIILNFFTYFYLTKKTDVKIPEYSMVEVNTSIDDPAVMDLLESQKQVDEKIKGLSENNEYTFDKPLIITDPYGNSPLSAIAVFTTPYPSKIIVKVESKDPNYEIRYATYDHGFTTNHIVPIYGLEADVENKVTLRTINKFWLANELTISIKTEAVEADTVEIIKENNKTLDKNFMIDYTKNKITLRDLKGNIHWFFNSFNIEETATMYNQNSFIGRIELNEKKFIARFDMMGRIEKIYDNLNSYGELYLSSNGIIMTQYDENQLLLINSMNDTTEILDIGKYYNQSKIKQINYDYLFGRYYVLFEDSTIISINDQEKELYFSSKNTQTNKEGIKIDQFSINNSKSSWSMSDFTDVAYLDGNICHINHLIRRENKINFFAEITIPIQGEIHDFRILEYNQIVVVSGNQMIIVKKDNTVTYDVRFKEPINKVQFYSY